MASSIVIRAALTPAEWRKMRKLSESTGISMGRLAADAIRAVHLDTGKHSVKA